MTLICRWLWLIANFVWSRWLCAVDSFDWSMTLTGLWLWFVTDINWSLTLIGCWLHAVATCLPPARLRNKKTSDFPQFRTDSFGLCFAASTYRSRDDAWKTMHWPLADICLRCMGNDTFDSKDDHNYLHERHNWVWLLSRTLFLLLLLLKAWWLKQNSGKCLTNAKLFQNSLCT